MTETKVSGKKRSTKGEQYFKNPYGSGKKFDAQAISDARSKFFRNFHRTKTKAYMTTFDDVQYLSILKCHLNNIAAGDPKTTFDLIIDKAWEQGAQTGNIKDLGTTGEPAFKLWIANWLIIAWDIAAQMILRPFLPAFTESSTTGTATNTLAIWTQSDWDNFVLSLEKLDCPDFVYRFMKPFLYVIRLTETYERAGIVIPPSYLVLIEHMYAMADLAAKRETAKGQAGEAMIHCKKFGIPFSKFSSAKLQAIELSKDELWNNQDLLAFFTIYPLRIYDNTPVVKTVWQSNNTIYTGANKTTDFTNTVYAFIEGQDMSILHALFPCFGATIVNNERGEIIGGTDPGATEYECNIRMMKLLGTTWDYGMFTTGSVDDAYRITALFAAFYSSDATGALYWMGTKVTANQPNNFARFLWFQVKPNIMIGTAVSYEEQLDSVDHAFRYMIYG